MCVNNLHSLTFLNPLTFGQTYAKIMSHSYINSYFPIFSSSWAENVLNLLLIWSYIFAAMFWVTRFLWTSLEILMSTGYFPFTLRSKDVVRITRHQRSEPDRTCSGQEGHEEDGRGEQFSESMKKTTSKTWSKEHRTDWELQIWKFSIMWRSDPKGRRWWIGGGEGRGMQRHLRK